MCSFHSSLLSKIRPKNLNLVTTGIRWPEMNRSGWTGGALSLENTIAANFSIEKMKRQSLAQSDIRPRNGLNRHSASSAVLAVRWAAKSSAQRSTLIKRRGPGKSISIMLNRRGLRIEPCGTPVNIGRNSFEWSAILTQKLLSVRKDLSHLRHEPVTPILASLKRNR